MNYIILYRELKVGSDMVRLYCPSQHPLNLRAMIKISGPLIYVE